MLCAVLDVVVLNLSLICVSWTEDISILSCFQSDPRGAVTIHNI